MATVVQGKVDPRFLREDGLEIFSGCELLVKGLLETEGGTHLWTGYPGSPVAAFFDVIENIAPLANAHGIKATIANNEALSIAMVNGSQMLGLRATAAMKSVGVHVASDALALGNLAGAHPEGGVVIIMGDDPWSDSTQVPADSRFLCRHLFMPMVEPSDPQELKDWIDLSFKLSCASGFYIGFLVTTNIGDGGGSVTVQKNQFPVINTNQPSQIDTSTIPLADRVILTPRTAAKENELESRRVRLWKEAHRLGINRILNLRHSSEVAFITAGESYAYLEHALTEMGLSDQFPILKLGITYPLDPELILHFAAQTRNLIVVEERRGFIEEQVAHILLSRSSADTQSDSWIDGKPIQIPRLWGKTLPDGDGLPSTLGLNPSLLIEKLAPALSRLGAVKNNPRIEQELALIRLTSNFDITLPERSPSFCPGCPHRDSSSVLISIKQDFQSRAYMHKNHGRDPVDLVFHGDTGCYTMLMFEPNQDLMHNYSGMGLGGATGAGIDPFIRNKQVVFMGDSTFFHSGQVAISNSIKNGQDITYIILDNKTTAMTGHQGTAATDMDILGKPQFQQNLDTIIQSMIGLGGADVLRVNPEQRDSYRALLEQTILRDGVKVIVADKECGITFHRRLVQEERKEIRQQGYLTHKKHINITQEVCENCLECTRATGCPGLTFAPTPYGPKVQTDLSWCVADTACAKTRACPSFEEVHITRKAAPESPLARFKLDDLPEPTQRAAFNDHWHAYMGGVGGMGIGVSTATLVRAGFIEGYRISFCDKKGMAIRNGGVYSQISFFKNGKKASNQIPYGKADLILGVDILEAVRGLDPRMNQRVGSPHHTTAVVNTEKTPTIPTLTGKDDFDPHDLETTLQCYTRRENYFGFNFSRISEKLFGKKMFANILLLGAAYQKGLLPLKQESLIRGIEQTMGSGAPENIKAFQIGRLIILHPEQFVDDPLSLTLEKLIGNKAHFLRESTPRYADAYLQLMKRARSSLDLEEDDFRDLAVRLSDLIWFENPALASRYLDLVTRVHERDRHAPHHPATRAVIWNLAKVMLIKDEVYVAHLLTSPEKLTRDQARYDVDPARGDHIQYLHINRPRFDIGPFKIEFDIHTRNWQLRLMKHMKFLRRLLPTWHREEKSFRDWYIHLARDFSPTNEAEYQVWLEILKTPENVTGYRHIRHPKQDVARKKAGELLARLPLPTPANPKKATEKEKPDPAPAWSGPA